MTILRSGSATDVGRVRVVNEDLALETLTLYAVADGMGGHAGGEIASRVAIDALNVVFSRHPTVHGLVDAIEEANRAVWDRGLSDPALRGMGTTLTAAALVGTDDGDRLVLANVGDSRTYLLHEGLLEQVTTDHSVAEELVARGELSEDEAQIHPHRHVLTRAIGVSPEVDVDVWQVEPREGDRFLLCSDGLTNEVSVDRIEAVLASTPDPEHAAEALVRLANDAGGNDNITAVVLDVVVADEPPAVLAVGHGAGAGVEHVVSGGDGAVVAAPVLEAMAPPAVITIDPEPSGSVLISRAASESSRSGRDTARSTGRPRVPRRITFRVLLFVILLGGVVAGAWALIRWYVDTSYFVGLQRSRVVIYQGRPGGFVGMEPKVVWRTDLTTSQVNSTVVPSLRAGVQEPSLKSALYYVQCAIQSLPMCTSAANTAPTSTTAALGYRSWRDSQLVTGVA